MCSVQRYILVAAAAILFKSTDGITRRNVSEATNRFSLDLMKIILQDSSANSIVSPVSVYTLLAILQQGARGKSREEVNNVLQAQPEDVKEAYRKLTSSYKESRPEMTLEYATRTFVRTGYHVKPEFHQTLVEDFSSSDDTVNFENTEASTKHINSWVANNTHGRISHLFDPDSIPTDTLLVLVNTIYFSSSWLNPYYKNVENRSFSPRAGEEIMVPTMYQTEFYHGGECDYLGAKYVHVNLKGGDDFSVLLVLPTKRHGLDSLVERLTADNITNMFQFPARRRVKLQWPKFKLNTEAQLIPVLQKLGIRDVFSASADLSGITTIPSRVSDVVQKAEIAVDEKGITASAATGLTIVPLSALYVEGAKDLEFIADHPFLFFIVDRINSVPLFAGRVSNPATT